MLVIKFDGVQMTTRQLLTVPSGNTGSSHSSNTDIFTECWTLNTEESTLKTNLPVSCCLLALCLLYWSLCIVYNITVCMSCKHGNMFHSIFMNIHYVAELIFIINCILKHKIISNIKIQWMGIKIQFYFDYSRTFLLFHICFDGETWKVFASSCQFKFPFLLLAVRFPQSTKF